MDTEVLIKHIVVYRYTHKVFRVVLYTDTVASWWMLIHLCLHSAVI